jgi:hypothetical protein
MATHQPPGDSDPRLPGEDDIARVYAAGAQDEPPATLDHKILAAAQQAVRARTSRKGFGARWAVPVSIAAVMVLTLGVLLRLQAPDPRTPTESGPPQAPAAAAVPPQPVAPLAARDALNPAPVQGFLQTPAPATSTNTADIAGAVATDAREERTPRRTDIPAAEPARASASTARKPLAESTKPDTPEAKVLAKGALTQEAARTPVHADVIAVRVGGQAGAYEFDVTLRSPDSGCQQYADWWEVVSEDGKLLYRRLLQPSHADQQPFTRSGGPVPVQATTVVWVRAHMHAGGYGGVVLKGSIDSGFLPADPGPGFAAHLAAEPPLPSGCDF